MSGGVEQETEGTRPLKVLLADQQPVVRSGLRAWLEPHRGFSWCGEAATSDELLAVALRTTPDLLVLDPLISAVHEVRKALPALEVLLYVRQLSERAAQAAVAGARAVLLETDTAETFLSALEALALHRPFLSAGLDSARWEQLYRAAQRGHPAPLTARETEVVRLVAGGLRTSQISSQLGISKKTVESHRGTIMRKLGARSVAAMVLFAVRNGLLTDGDVSAETPTRPAFEYRSAA